MPIHILRYIKLTALCLFCGFSATRSCAESPIEVLKGNVLHRFVRIDQATDHFTQNVFPTWEEETFSAFDLVKDPQGIAIDLGAWIGTTSIWLSKNFHHVIAVDGDKEAIKCLHLNLAASECFNVTVCEKVIAQSSQEVIFGPRGPVLNESISYLKPCSNSPLDYKTKSLTFKQLIYDTVYANKELECRKISLIKCDIEGGEENILEDVLHFAFYNKCPVLMSFHIDWWTSKKITDFDWIFDYFDVSNYSIDNISQFLQAHPFANVLLTPRENVSDLIKANIPAVIIGYNQPTYIKNMVSQLEKYTKDIIILDNNSDYQPLLDYYQNDFKYTLLKMDKNYGHAVYRRDFLKNIVGDIFLLTDPDLKFNQNLPDNFIHELIRISNQFHSGRVGFALFIDSEDIRTDVTFAGYSIKDWEIRFWQLRLDYSYNPNLVLYSAPIDTTFGLFNRKYEEAGTDGNHIRVAGDFTCMHLPWHKNFQDNLLPGEYEHYLKTTVTGTWFRKDM